MHLNEQTLALYTGKDLGPIQRWRAAFHLGRCEQCRLRLESYQEAREQLRRQTAALPAGLNWDRLAAEMTANIHLGLAAGECVGVRQTPAQGLAGWRPALVLASALLVVTVAWWANSGKGPVPMTNLVKAPQAAVVQGVRLEMTSAGIGVNDNGRVLTLKNPKEGDVAFSVNIGGSMRARYVDAETGQVTINNVYVQ